MQNTYEIKTNLFGQEYLQMITPNGLIEFVPMSLDNADYQAYLASLEE
jgi:hypothetical protein